MVCHSCELCIVLLDTITYAHGEYKDCAEGDGHDGGDCIGGGDSDVDVLMVMLEKATKARVIVKPKMLIARKTVNRVYGDDKRPGQRVAAAEAADASQ